MPTQRYTVHREIAFAKSVVQAAPDKQNQSHPRHDAPQKESLKQATFGAGKHNRPGQAVYKIKKTAPPHITYFVIFVFSSNSFFCKKIREISVKAPSGREALIVGPHWKEPRSWQMQLLHCPLTQHRGLDRTKYGSRAGILRCHHVGVPQGSLNQKGQ